MEKGRGEGSWRRVVEKGRGEGSWRRVVEKGRGEGAVVRGCLRGWSRGGRGRLGKRLEETPWRRGVDERGRGEGIEDGPGTVSLRDEGRES